MALNRWRRIATGAAAGIIVLSAALIGASFRDSSDTLSIAEEVRLPDAIVIPEDDPDQADSAETIADDDAATDDAATDEAVTDDEATDPETSETEDPTETDPAEPTDAATDDAAATDDSATDPETSETDPIETDPIETDGAATDDDEADDAVRVIDEDDVVDPEDAAQDPAPEESAAQDPVTEPSEPDEAAPAEVEPTPEPAPTQPPAVEPPPPADPPAAPPISTDPSLGTGGGVDDAECAIDRLVIYAGARVGGVAGSLRAALAQSGFGAGCNAPVTVLASNCPQQFSGVLRAGSGYDPSQPYVASSPSVDRGALTEIIGRTGFTGSQVNILNFGFVVPDKPGEQWVAIFIPPSFSGWENLASRAGLSPSTQSLCAPSGELAG